MTTVAESARVAPTPAAISRTLVDAPVSAASKTFLPESMNSRTASESRESEGKYEIWIAEECMFRLVVNVVISVCCVCN